MKKYLYILAFMSVCIMSYAQNVTSSTRVVVPPNKPQYNNYQRPQSSYVKLDGRFYCYTDPRTGRQSVYFQADNNTNKYVNIRVQCVNDRLRDHIERNINLTPNASFAIGLSEGWNWQEGEKLYIFYPNGQRQIWVFQSSRMTYINSACTVNGCYCPGYVSSNDAYPTLSVCRNCGHPISEHNF
ncbi:MAG: hypothetical protein PHD21_08420 [Flavobacteriales bacterium]|nr:hypothetical protein [Flavobacteriales bacterium]